MRTAFIALVAALALGAALPSAQTPAKPAASKLTIDQLIEIKHPSGHQWTPDGHHIFWLRTTTAA